MREGTGRKKTGVFCHPSSFRGVTDGRTLPPPPFQKKKGRFFFFFFGGGGVKKTCLRSFVIHCRKVSSLSLPSLLWALFSEPLFVHSFLPPSPSPLPISALPLPPPQGRYTAPLPASLKREVFFLSPYFLPAKKNLYPISSPPPDPFRSSGPGVCDSASSSPPLPPFLSGCQNTRRRREERRGGFRLGIIQQMSRFNFVVNGSKQCAKPELFLKKNV